MAVPASTSSCAAAISPQRERAGDARLQHAPLGQRHDRPRPRLAHGARHVHALHEVQLHALEPEGVVGQHRLAHARGRVGRDRAVVRDHRAVDRDVGAEVDLDDALHARPAGDLHHAGRHILLGVVDHVVGAGRARDRRLLGRADRGDHPGPAPARQLHRHHADRARAALHQHPLSRHRPVRQRGVIGRERRHAQARALGERQGVRQRNRIGLRHRHVFSRRPLARPRRPRAIDEHPLALLQSPHARPDARDRPRPVAVRHHARCVHLRPQPPRPALGVVRVDARGHHLHEHLAVPRLRRRHLAQLEHLPRRPHAPIPSRLHPHSPVIARVLGAGLRRHDARGWGHHKPQPPSSRRRPGPMRLSLCARTDALRARGNDVAWALRCPDYTDRNRARIPPRPRRGVVQPRRG